MMFVDTDFLNLEQKTSITALWNQEYPEKLKLPTVTDFENYLASLQDLNQIILTDDANSIKGWLAYFKRDGEKWFAMLIDPSLQGKGWGSGFLGLAKQRNTELNGWVIDNDTELKQNGEAYKSPLSFYLKNGFEVSDNVIIEKKGVRGIKVSWKQGDAMNKP